MTTNVRPAARVRAGQAPRCLRGAGLAAVASVPPPDGRRVGGGWSAPRAEAVRPMVYRDENLGRYHD